MAPGQSKKKVDTTPAPSDQVVVDDGNALIARLNDRIAALENLLLSTRDDLQMKQEALEVQAEELESQNDELRSNNRALEEVTVSLQEREAELAKLAAIVTSSDNAIIGKTLDGTITSWNAAAERIYGYSAAEALGRHIDLIMPPGLSGELRAMLLKIGAGQRVDHHETQRVTKNGRVIDMSITVSPIVDRDGRVIGASTIARDIAAAKAAENALKKSQFILAKSQEMARVGNWAWNVQTGEMKGSDENYRLYGYQPGDFTPTVDWVRNCVHSGDLAAMDRFVETVRRDGARKSVDYRIRRQDGTIRYLMTVADKIVRDEAGHVRWVYGITQDITERKQLEEALKEREKQLTSRLNAILSPGRFDDKTIAEIVDIPSLQEMADSFHELTGVANAIIDLNGVVLVGSGWQDICTKFHRCHPETSKNCIESDRHLSGSVEEGKYVVYKCKNGMWDAATPIVVNGRHIANLFIGQFFFDDEVPDYDYFRRQSRIYNFNGDEYMASLERVPRHSREKIREVMGFYTRFAAMVSQLSYSNVQLAGSLIRQRRSEQALQEKMEEIEVQAEELESQNEEISKNYEVLHEVTRSLHDSEALLRAVTDTSPDVIFVKDRESRIVLANPATLRAIGKPLEKVVGKNDREFYDDPAIGETMMANDRRVMESGETEVLEEVVQTPGGLRTFLSTKTPFRNPRGEITGILGVSRDITERKQAEEELKDAKDQAELYLDLMGHDISNMHQIALSQLELAQEIMRDEGQIAGEEIELLTTPVETLERSARLIENVSKLQKLRAGEYRLESVDLGKVLSEVVEENCVPGNGVAIRLSGASGCRVMANPLIKEAFTNLVGNAVKHTPGSPEINVAVSRVAENGSSFYRIAIEDNGPGIPDEKKGEIFHRFKRGQTKAKGTGLGLYIARTLVDNFKGRILVEDRVPGHYTKGSKFIVYLPVAED